jgi:hypothetical protein
MIDTAYTQDVFMRLEKLERFVLAMKVSLVLCVLLIAAPLVMGQAPNNQTLRAQRIVLSVPSNNSQLEISPNGLHFTDSARLSWATYSSDSIVMFGKDGGKGGVFTLGLDAPKFFLNDADKTKTARYSLDGFVVTDGGGSLATGGIGVVSLSFRS